MPNIPSAAKRMRQAERARQKNFSVKSRIKSVRGTVRDAAAKRDAAALEQAYRQYCSVLDRAAKQGIIKNNTAIRRKRRTAAMLHSLQSK